MPKKTETKATSTGICNFCQGEFEKGKMTQHLKYCKQRLSGAKAGSQEKSGEVEKTKLFHLVVEGHDHPMYWMHLEVPADATLDDLDDFLRDTWLECCGHLSEFRIGKMSYLSQTEEMMWGFGDADSTLEDEDEEENEDDDAEEEEEEEGEEEELADLSPLEVATKVNELLSAEFQRNLTEVPLADLEAKLTELLTAGLRTELGMSMPAEVQPVVSTLARLLHSGLLLDFLDEDEDEERDMDVELEKVLKPGLKFSYEYDFGSTTELRLRVISEREAEVHEDEDLVEVLARNIAPVISCRECGKPATKILSGYFYAEDGALCDECAKSQKPGGYEEVSDEDEEDGEYDDSDEYDEDEDGMFLPVVNSPRVGVCAYTG